MASRVLKLSKSEQVVFDNCSTKSGWIRYLTSLEWTRGEIVRYLNTTVLKGKKQIRYQHVRNVLLTPVTNPTDKF